MIRHFAATAAALAQTLQTALLPAGDEGVKLLRRHKSFAFLLGLLANLVNLLAFLFRSERGIGADGRHLGVRLALDGGMFLHD